ncbi:hypothetical protein B0H66DRAFT_385158 [Apodospora peruviana]|uniref:Dol-P-Man:Man(5)GlcNAc(2)-PP-Dol alpha-1,3-mannosyltransferase n=1 Tax=Apodospora peruviana TaxID=516989 RepID=A0AAE0LZ48_9PEZI|nr:hypothetical protein B0H66DRAFT_385158 [Apodospora peruviana]
MTTTKLAPVIKELINVKWARPGPTPAPLGILDVYSKLKSEATEGQFGERPWLALSAAATFTLNSPTSLAVLHHVAATQTSLGPVPAAELIREVGLKCISFNGIPRTINCLGAFRQHLEREGLGAELETQPTRMLTPENIAAVNQRGRNLWQSVYTPLDEKLESKLATSHPDLPVYILGGHYGPLLSDPTQRGRLGVVGRTLTSVVAIACLRAQTGVGPQVLSHVYGLLKAVEQGAHREELEEVEAKGVETLATDLGCEWLLRSVDAISDAIGTSFAQPLEDAQPVKVENAQSREDFFGRESEPRKHKL